MESKDQYVQKAIKRMQTSREYVKPYFDRFLDNYKHYYMRIIDEAVEDDPESYPLYSQVHLPITFQTVETLLPRMFIRLPNYRIETEMEGDENSEQALNNLVRYQMNHPYLIDDPIFSRLTGGLKECFITGNMWGEVPWYKIDDEVEEWQPYSSILGLPPSWDNLPILDRYGIKPQWMLVKVNKTVFDAPLFEHRSVFHVFPDVNKKRVSDMRYAIVEDYMDMEQILNLANADPKNFKDIDDLKKLKPMSGKGGEGTDYDNELAGIFGSSDHTFKDSGIKKDGQYKVWFQKEKSEMTIIVNEKLCIRAGSNPNGNGKLGLFLMKDIPIPHELYAWGEVDPVKRLEDGMSDQFNMRNDSVFYDLLRMWEVNTSALVDGEEFIPEPGNVIQTKESNAIRPLETGTTKSSAYREYQEWEQIIQGATGITDYATGQNDPSMNKTRGGVELLQQAANHRFAFKLQNFEQLGLKAMGTMYIERNLRYFDTPQSVKDENGFRNTVEPGDIRRIRGNTHFIVEAGSTESVYTQTELEKWKYLGDKVAENKPPFQNLTPQAQDRIAKRILSALKINNADELLERMQPQPGAPGVPGVPGAQGLDPAATAMLDAQIPAEAGGANVEPNPQVLQQDPGQTATV